MTHAAAQKHEQTRVTQDHAISENGLYDAGWIITCQCGQDVSPNRGRASKRDTQRAMNAHLTRHGATVLPENEVTGSILGVSWAPALA